MKIVGIVPARGGSKGIPNKNLKKIGGIPLVARSVLALKATPEIVRTYVSSDSQEILSAGEFYGAIPFLRPSFLAADQTSTEDVLIHFLDEMASLNQLPDILVYLQCTSPFTKSDDIQKVLSTLINNPKIDCAFSAIEDHSFLWEIDDKNFGRGVNHEAYAQRNRRQDLGRVYKENGAVYAVRVENFMTTKNRFGSAAIPVPILKTLPFEIDDIHELKLATQLSPLFPLPGLNEKIKLCKAIVMDFDGVLTNDSVTVNELGHESVVCSRADGLGIGLLKNAGIKMLILTREENPVVQKRAVKIGVEIISGVKQKLPELKKWATTNNLQKNEIAYVGNDINDLDCMKWVGFPVAPSDAHINIIALGCTILASKGGEGVIREVANIFLDLEK